MSLLTKTTRSLHVGTITCPHTSTTASTTAGKYALNAWSLPTINFTRSVFNSCFVRLVMTAGTSIFRMFQTPPKPTNIKYWEISVNSNLIKNLLNIQVNFIISNNYVVDAWFCWPPYAKRQNCLWKHYILNKNQTQIFLVIIIQLFKNIFKY